MANISAVNYDFINSEYTKGNLDGINLQGSKNGKKIYQLGKSLHFDSLIDKIIQLIDRILSYFNLEWEWPKKHMEFKASEILLAFNKKTKTPASKVNAFLLSNEMLDVTQNHIFPLLKKKDIRNLFKALLPSLPLRNKKAGRLYLEKFSHKWSINRTAFFAALRLCGHQFSSIDLNFFCFSDENFKMMGSLCPNLTSLTAPQGVVNDKNIESICNAFPRLNSLDIRWCFDLTDTGLEYLSKKLPNLIKLNISVCSKITEVGLQSLSELTQLTSLDYNNNLKVTNISLQHIAKLTNLTSLSIAGLHTDVTDVGLQSVLSQLKNLTFLDIGGKWVVTDTSLQYLSQLTHLTSLRMGRFFRTTGGFQYLSYLTNLTSLHIEDPRITDSDLQNLSLLTKLTFLRIENRGEAYRGIEGGKITDGGLQFVAQFINLTDLSIDDCRKITDNGVQYLSQLTNLTSLNLWGWEPTEIGLQYLSQLRNLTRLNVCDKISGSDGWRYLPDDWLRDLSEKLPNLHISHNQYY